MSTMIQNELEPRGCGYRMAGGIYLETRMAAPGEDGDPITDMLICPPAMIDVQALGISPIGVKLINVGGVYHVFDRIGLNNYPNVADFIEEAIWRGVSRRIARSTEFNLLTRDSRLILIHDRAGIVNADELRAAIAQPVRCPAQRAHDHDVNCLGLSYHDLDERDITGAIQGHRSLGSYSYAAYARPDGVTIEHQPAIFMSVPIQKIAVIRDDIGGMHNESLAKLQGCTLPVSLEDA